MAGCASYVAPGRAADFGAMGVTHELQQHGTPASMREAFDRKPLASWPASIAVARVQASGYRSRTAAGYGQGTYSIVTNRDVEKDVQFERLVRLPMVKGVAPIGKVLLMSTPQLNSDVELREAAATLQADMVLIYTLDTEFWVRDMATPLTVLSLGLSPSQEARVTTTASAVLIDTRSGFVYGLAEATEQNNRLASAWTSEDAIDAARLKTEEKAFEKLVVELEKTWSGVVTRYAPAVHVGG